MTMDRKSAEQQYALSRLLKWSGLDPHGVYPKAVNAQETFEVYAQVMDCRFEDVMRKAADALLAEFREANTDFQFHKTTDPSIFEAEIAGVIAKVCKERL